MVASPDASCPDSPELMSRKPFGTPCCEHHSEDRTLHVQRPFVSTFAPG